MIECTKCSFKMLEYLLLFVSRRIYSFCYPSLIPCRPVSICLFILQSFLCLSTSLFVNLSSCRSVCSSVFSYLSKCLSLYVSPHAYQQYLSFKEKGDQIA